MNERIYCGDSEGTECPFGRVRWVPALNLFLKQEGKCYYTDYPITLNTRNRPKTASIDRIDNNKGYIEGNVVWCRKDINIMKMDKDIEDFYEICRLIAKKNPK